MFAAELPCPEVALYRLYSIAEDEGVPFEALEPAHFEDLALMLLADCEGVPAVLLRPMVDGDELEAWVSRVGDAFALDALRQSVESIEHAFRLA